MVAHSEALANFFRFMKVLKNSMIQWLWLFGPVNSLILTTNLAITLYFYTFSHYLLKHHNLNHLSLATQ